MPNRPPPNNATCRLAALAWDVINTAYDEARDKPIERTTLHKLALGYLVVTGFAARGQLTTIWEILGHEGTFEQTNCRQAYYGPVFYGIKDRIEKRQRMR